MANLIAVQPFDCEGDPSSVGIRWEKWLRSFEIYLEASNIDNAVKRRATLLHCGGTALQEIYYNLPGAHVEPENGVDIYKTAVEKLNDYFQPKQSKIYERHLFRLTKQEQGEKFEKFLVRLRNQAAKCKFTNMEEHLIDQIVEKGTSVDLRKKILAAGDAINLDGIIAEANALEAVNRQLEDFVDPKSKTIEVNLVSRTKNCTRCGGNHSSNFPKCPAKLKTCTKCGYKGHFQNYCRTTNRKRFRDEPGSSNYKQWPKSERTKRRRPQENISKQNVEEEETDYLF